MGSRSGERGSGSCVLCRTIGVSRQAPMKRIRDMGMLWRSGERHSDPGYAPRTGLLRSISSADWEVASLKSLRLRGW